jgi:hypothetical protein
MLTFCVKFITVEHCPETRFESRQQATHINITVHFYFYQGHKMSVNFLCSYYINIYFLINFTTTANLLLWLSNCHVIQHII